MALTITHAGDSGRTLKATLQRRVNGSYWSQASGAWESSPTFANKSITLTEGTSENLGSYRGANTGDLGDAGWVAVRVHDTGSSNAVVGVGQCYVWAGDEADPQQGLGYSSLAAFYLDATISSRATPSQVASEMTDRIIAFDLATTGDITAAVSTLESYGDTSWATATGFATATTLAAVKAKTDLIPASPAAVGSAMTLTSGERTSIGAAVWAALTSSLTTVGSIGKLIVDNLNATVSSRSTLDSTGAQSAAAAALSAYDPPTRTEATADKDAILAQGDSAWATATGFAEPGDAMTLTTGERDAVAVVVESHLLDEGDSQLLINAIVGAIGNTNVDQAVLVAAIRADIERTGGTLATILADMLTTAEVETAAGAALTTYDAATGADVTSATAGLSVLNSGDVQAAAEAALTAFDALTVTQAAADRDAILGAVGTPLQAGGYTAPDNAGIAAIQERTDNLPNDPAGVSDLPSVAGLSTFDPMTDSVKLAPDQSAVTQFGGVDVTGSTFPASGDWTTDADLPANFAALGINASGHVSRVTLVDTTTTNADMRGTDGAYTGTPPTPPTASENATAVIRRAVTADDIAAVMATDATLVRWLLQSRKSAIVGTGDEAVLRIYKLDGTTFADVPLTSDPAAEPVTGVG